jgi:hypothetical protein
MGETPRLLCKLVGVTLFALSAPFLFAGSASTATGISHDDELYSSWMKMYDLKFDEAHQIFSAWKQAHPTEALGPASDAAAFLFSELARLGVLESKLFADDSRFKHRAKLEPDPAKKALFMQEIAQADSLADSSLLDSAADQTALFVKSLTFGLRADNAGLIEKQSSAAVSYIKDSRAYADRLLHVNPDAFDAYLAPGIENYLLSLKPAPIRLLLRLSGANVGRQKGIEELQQTALHGYYLEPFAKLLLAVAALRDNHQSDARNILSELHRRFPDNELYTRELDQLPR